MTLIKFFLSFTCFPTNLLLIEFLLLSLHLFLLLPFCLSPIFEYEFYT